MKYFQIQINNDWSLWRNICVEFDCKIVYYLVVTVWSVAALNYRGYTPTKEICR